MNDADKTLLATIHLGPGSTDRALAAATATTNDTAADIAALTEHISMYEIPTLMPEMEGCHPSTGWEPKQSLGHHSPLIRSMTPIPEVTSNSNGNGSEDSQMLNPYMSDNHSHNNLHQALHNSNNLCDPNNLSTTTTHSLTVNVTLPDQRTPSPPLTAQRTHHQQHNYHHHQYGAVDQLSAAFLHLSHLYHPFSFSPSVSPPPFSGSSSPCNTPFPSTYPPASPSLSSPSICGSPYGLSMPATPGGPSYNMNNHQHHSFFNTGFEQHVDPSSWPPSASTSSRSFIPRSSPIMTRRRSQAFLEKQAAALSSSSSFSSQRALSHSTTIMTRRRSQALTQKALLVAAASKKASSSSLTKPKPLPFARLTTSKTPAGGGNGGGARTSSATTTSFPSSPLNPAGLTTNSLSLGGYNNGLICQICKKEYANNSTLRRHLKIHAYASTSTATRKICAPSPTNAAAVAAHSGSNGPTGDPNSALSSIPESPGSNNTSNHDIATPMSSTLAAVNTHLLSSFWPYRDLPAPSTIMNNAAVSVVGQTHHLQSHMAAAAAAAVGGGVMTNGYNPSSDPNIKKPECVGCSKSFARRDTVILHIKNQKRKWDLLCAMLPALSTSASSSATGNVEGVFIVGPPGDDADDDGDNDDEDGRVVVMDGPSSDLLRRQNHARHKRPSSLTRTAAGAKLVGPVHKRQVRQRRAHPFRVAEKLWQSTLQRKKIHFGAYKKPAVPITTAATTPAAAGAGTGAATTTSAQHSVYKLRQSMYEGDEEYDDEEFTEHRKGGGDVDMEMNAYIEEQNDDEEEDEEDGWPSQEALDGMDNQAKLQWMMKMAVEPPCWSERKVRLFGAYGMVEETVLQ
ncbi:hypothetical protein BGW39_002910 [Mortierella sp. 14UC]|nr:hypothetical protein BGW39_002910 [Mortierella sp. 14UC]